MQAFEVPIFPEGSALTVATTVLVGVWVIAYFNLAFGSTLSGLVVPGYLVPLIIAKPWSVGVIVCEAILTYLIVVTISERPRFLPWWSSFFGRDRFFAIVLVSVLVRALGDGWLLPRAGQWIDENLSISIDYRNDLHSYGLIIVALLANCFWKPGLVRGLTTTMSATLVTYAITSFVLVPWTNFNVGELQYLYEDISSSLLASPKAYIILITTAYLASWMNLRFSWEFNGILIPALLGLLWHEPLKIVSSVTEAAILFGVGSVLLQLPVFKRITMTGARKLLFFFTLCFSLRLLVGHLVERFSPDLPVSEMLGFGFLLTTLMAIKAHDKQLGVRLVVGTLQVSLAGALLGSLIGFALLKLPNPFDRSRASGFTHSSPIAIDKPLGDVVKADKLLIYQMRARGRYQPPSARERSAFEQTLEAASEYAAYRDPAQLEKISRLATMCNYEVAVVADRYLYLREQEPPRGWGIYVLDLEEPEGLCVEVPAPLDEWSTIESGMLLAQQLKASAIAIAGADRQTNKDGSSDVLIQPRSIFSVFHRRHSGNGVLQVRGHTNKSLRTANRLSSKAPDDSRANPGSVFTNDSTRGEDRCHLWVVDALPSGVRPKILQAFLPGYRLMWQPSPSKNMLRKQTSGPFAELWLTRKDRRTLANWLAQSADQPGGHHDETGGSASMAAVAEAVAGKPGQRCVSGRFRSRNAVHGSGSADSPARNT